MLRSHRRLTDSLRCDCAAAVTGMAEIVSSSRVWCVPATCRALAIVAASVGLLIWVSAAWVTFTSTWRTHRFGFQSS
ncbi:Helicase [Zea mays]|uniref:Helicase n=1 Tax=Zea mays TaxID=4577 RepID=A0A1D6E3M3_MAIZE|nr:Helicase [Zea mays]